MFVCVCIRVWTHVCGGLRTQRKTTQTRRNRSIKMLRQHIPISFPLVWCCMDFWRSVIWAAVLFNSSQWENKEVLTFTRRSEATNNNEHAWEIHCNVFLRGEKERCEKNGKGSLWETIIEVCTIYIYLLLFVYLCICVSSIMFYTASLK